MVLILNSPCYCPGTQAGTETDPHMTTSASSSLQRQGFGSGAQASVRVQASMSSCPTATDQTQANTPPSSYSAALRMHTGAGGEKRQGNWKHISSLQLRTILSERHNPRHHLQPKEAQALAHPRKVQFNKYDLTDQC